MPPCRKGLRMDEQTRIDEAVKAAGGNYGTGLSALQRQCIQPLLDQGLTNVAARKRCEREYPLIFGPGRRRGRGSHSDDERFCKR